MIFLSFGLTLVSAGLFAGFLVGLGSLIAQLLSGRNPHGQIWLLVLLAVGTAISEAIRIGIQQAGARAEGDALQIKLLGWAFQLGPQKLQLHRAGALVDLMTSGVEKIQNYRQGYLGGMWGGMCIPVLILIIMGWALDPLSAGILAGFIPMIPLLVFGFRKITKRVSGKSRRVRNALAAAYLEAISGLETLTLLGAAGRRADDLAEAGERNRKATMRVLRANQLILLVIDAGFNLLLITVAFGLTAWRLSSGYWGSSEQAFGKAVSMMGLAFLLLEPMRQIGGFFYVGMGGMANQRRVKAFLTGETSHSPSAHSAGKHPGSKEVEPDGGTLALRPETQGGTEDPHSGKEKAADSRQVPSAEGVFPGQSGNLAAGLRADDSYKSKQSAPLKPTESGPNPAKAENVLPQGSSSPSAPRNKVAISLKEVKFSYPDQPPVLNGVNLEVKSGQKIAIFGPSAEGKTTLVQLVKGNLLPEGGQVVIDGVHLNAKQQTSVRHRSALVQQSTWAFTGTIRSNLTMVSPLAKDEELWEVLERVHLAAEVRSFPQQLDTPIGEQGLGLSGGQMQRLSLARALLSGRKLLLLDEPTSQIDLASEAAIMQAISQLDCETTVLMITHRRSTLAVMDRVLELKKGQLTGQKKPGDFLKEPDEKMGSTSIDTLKVQSLRAKQEGNGCA